MDIFNKIRQAGLIWRAGAFFPLAEKRFAAEVLTAKGLGKKKCYVVCNAAQGEAAAVKSGYILEHYSKKVIDGLKIAVDFLSAEKGYLFLDYNFYKKHNKKLIVLLKNSKIEIFIKPVNAGYIGGEAGAVLNAIEGRRIEPRLKPPDLTAKGLWDCPTFINNVETFYNVSLVAADQASNKKFYAITGDCLNQGVYELPDNLTIEELLKQTKNYPRFSFFVQAGDFASGEVLNSSQLNQPVNGDGLIAVYSLAKNNFKRIIAGWLDFFAEESCGQCAPCREGTYRLKEIFAQKKINWELFNGLLDNLGDTALCAFGSSAPLPIKSFMKNVSQILNEKN